MSVLECDDDLIGYHDTSEIDDLFSYEPQNLSNKNLLNFFHTNIRSLNKNFEELVHFLANINFKFHIIALSETWITDDAHFTYSLEGYNVVQKKSKHSKCDGICLFVDKNFHFDMIDLDIKESNSIGMACSIDNIKYTIILIYRSPATNINNFVTSLDACLNRMKDTTNVILMGDINLNILENNSLTNEYLSTLHINGFKSYINKPTRIVNGNGTCIDHIFFKEGGNNRDLQRGVIITDDITDHYSISLHLSEALENNAVAGEL